MTAARLQLASVLVVVARWSMDLDVIFISGVRCTAMIKDEYIESFLEKEEDKHNSSKKDERNTGLVTTRKTGGNNIA